MPLPTPTLDGRNLNQLLAEAHQRIRQNCPRWTDRSPNDPGIMLLELFAYLTDDLIQRMNRLPEVAYNEFLRLLGVTLHPPSAAEVKLTFSLAKPQVRPVEIPKGTRVTLARVASGDTPPVFVTLNTHAIAPGQTQVDIAALNGDWIEGELAGRGTGMPGVVLRASKPPIIAPARNGADLMVGVETLPDEMGERARGLQYEGKAFRIWREVENFSNLGPDRCVYMVDRSSGMVTFAPALDHNNAGRQLDDVPEALADVVPAGRDVRLWYLRGGGPGGNVAANMLTVLKDPIPGVQVTNKDPATGGRAAESLANALRRGPQELHSLQRAVTASDFEWVALRSSGAISRAMAFTKASVWAHANAGTVMVLLIPYLPEEKRPQGVSRLEDLKAQETEDARHLIQMRLDERRPLGTTCIASWCRYKVVSIRAEIGLHQGEDPIAVRERVLQRLHQTINPLPTAASPNGWPFGKPLRASNVYDITLAEPGVSYVDHVRLLVDEVPDQRVTSLAADVTQPQTWFAATTKILFRSINNADGWEAVARFPDEDLSMVNVHPGYAGLVAAVTQDGDNGQESKIYLSHDCGENWEMASQTAFRIRDVAWTLRDRQPILLLATDVGLYELSMQPSAGPIQVLVNADMEEKGYYAITSAVDVRGTAYVALAAQKAGGVFLSSANAQPGSFTCIGFKDQPVRVLTVQQDGLRSFLWLGLAVPGNEEGQGCFSWELRGAEPPPEGWRQFKEGWTGGSCRGMAFQGKYVVAATHHGGVLRVDASKSDAVWEKPGIDCGLPTRDVKMIFHPVDALAVDPSHKHILAAGPEGVFRSADGKTYRSASSRIFTDKVTLPKTWLFCSGQHEIKVIESDET